MHEQFFRDITKGMDVYDYNGDKVGTIGGIYQPAAAGPTPPGSTASTTAQPAGQFYLKVDTGFLGLGKDLFMPSGAISSVTDDRVSLSVDKDRLDDMGWNRPPDWLGHDRV
jgi:hypothetical protein